MLSSRMSVSKSRLRSLRDHMREGGWDAASPTPKKRRLLPPIITAIPQGPGLKEYERRKSGSSEGEASYYDQGTENDYGR